MWEVQLDGSDGVAMDPEIMQPENFRDGRTLEVPPLVCGPVLRTCRHEFRRRRHFPRCRQVIIIVHHRRRDKNGPLRRSIPVSRPRNLLRSSMGMVMGRFRGGGRAIQGSSRSVRTWHRAQITVLVGIISDDGSLEILSKTIVARWIDHTDATEIRTDHHRDARSGDAPRRTLTRPALNLCRKSHLIEEMRESSTCQKATDFFRGGRRSSLETDD